MLGQLNLVVRDMDATLAFYRCLGLDVPADAGAFHASARLPGGLLVEWDTEEFAASWMPGCTATAGGGVVLGMWVPTRPAVDRTVAELAAAGHPASLPPHDAFWGGRYAVVDDPDGVHVGIMSPADEARSFWPP